MFLTAVPALADLTGILRDPSGAPLDKAQIEVTSAATSLRLSTQTNPGGIFHFFALPPGTYSLKADKTGFAPLTRDGLTLRINEIISLDLTLHLGGNDQSLTVTAAAPLLQSSRGTVSFAVEQKRVEELPLDGRNFVPLIALSPGVSLPPGSFFPRINGSRPRTSEYIYDGISVLQPEPGQVAFYPIIDSISEFRIETSTYSAEYGRSNGGIILVNQKSGTNRLHGTAFEFFRNELLNARNRFATSGPKPRFRRNQYGGVLGGAIVPNKAFFFAAWQGTLLNTGIVRTSTIPTVLQKQGIFGGSIGTIPPSRLDPVAASLITRYPNTTLGGPNNYTRTTNDDIHQNQFDARIDHYFSPRHRAFARYSALRDNTVSPQLDTTSIAQTRAGSLATEFTSTLSPAAVNQARLGYTFRNFNRNNTTDPLPTYDIVGYQALGPATNINANLLTSVTQFIDIFSTLKGRHSLKLGTDIRLERINVAQPANPSGNFQFTNVFNGNSLASFMLGQVTRYSIDKQLGLLQPRARIAEFFVQDDFRATDRLTLNLGLRYTLNFPSTVIDNRLAVFNLNTQQLDFPNNARNLEKLNFAPRLGLAYRPSNTRAIRAGYGLTWIEQAGITTPFTAPLFPFIQTLTQQANDNQTPAFQLSQGPTVQAQPPNADAGRGQGVFATQRDNGSGYAQQWNLSLQHTFAANLSIEIGYLGSKLTRLGVPDINLNQVRFEDLAQGRLTRAYPNFNIVSLYRNNTGNSTYHSFQSRIEERLSRGLTLTAAYTWSKLIDDAGAVFDSAILSGPVLNYQAADSFNKRLEKDASTGHIPHIFSSSLLYQFPRGLELATILRAQSGSPLAVTQATNFNAFAGYGIQRPNRIASPALPPSQRSTARYFNTSAFTQANQGQIGTSSRNPVTGPSYQTIDIALSKTFPLQERLKAEFRAEVFNLLNTPPLGNPNTSFGTVAFGSITTALDPRVFELVLKLSF